MVTSQSCSFEPVISFDHQLLFFKVLILIALTYSCFHLSLFTRVNSSFLGFPLIGPCLPIFLTMPTKPRVIYWFRTDLRLHDSPALQAALDLKPECLYPIWCWDPKYIYRARVGPNRWQFLYGFRYGLCLKPISSARTNSSILPQLRLPGRPLKIHNEIEPQI